MMSDRAGTVTGVDDLVAWLRAQMDIDDRIADEMDLIAAAHHRVTVGINAAGQVGTRSCLDGQYLRREVEAKRMRLNWIEQQLSDDPADESALWLLRVDALPFADRPGYREEWCARCDPGQHCWAHGDPHCTCPTCLD